MTSIIGTIGISILHCFSFSNDNILPTSIFVFKKHFGEDKHHVGAGGQLCGPLETKQT